MAKARQMTITRRTTSPDIVGPGRVVGTEERQQRPDRPAGAVPHVILLGGSGDVGSRLARLLLEHTEAVVTTVSRRAGQGAGQTDSRLRHVSFDLSSGLTMAEAAGAIVVNLTEATPPSAVRMAIESGGWFLETSATPDYLNAAMTCAEGAFGPGTAIFCVGAAPGLTNLMAAEIASKAPDTVQIDIGVEMGMGRHYGFAATEWFLRTAGRPYPLVIDHLEQRVAPGQFTRRFAFKKGHSPRHAIGFGFAEQRVIAARSGRHRKTVRSFVALDPPWLTRFLAIMLKLGLGPAIGRHARRLTRWLMRAPSLGPTQTRLMSEGVDSSGQLTAAMRLETGDQAKATAATILATIQAILGPDRSRHRGVTTITDHLRLDAAVAVLGRVLPETTTDATYYTGLSDTEKYLSK